MEEESDIIYAKVHFGKELLWICSRFVDCNCFLAYREEHSSKWYLLLRVDLRQMIDCLLFVDLQVAQRVRVANGLQVGVASLVGVKACTAAKVIFPECYPSPQVRFPSLSGNPLNFFDITNLIFLRSWVSVFQ